MNAPLAVFAYNRPDHLNQTLTALAANKRAKDSDLFVFIDGPKNAEGLKKNSEVFQVALQFEDGYFSSVEIRNSDQNKGLAKSVITGVSEIIHKYGQVIVTEDDSVSSPNYLDFMNEALDYYCNDQDIFSIGGYTVPMALPDDYKKDVIFTQRSSSYAWATWADRWDKIDWSVADYKKFRFDFIARKRFNAWGKDRASMLDDQMNGRVNSWAIRFDYAMFKNGMYNVIPRTSLIRNIGHDGSGTHSIRDSGKDDPFYVDVNKTQSIFKMDKIVIDDRIRKTFCIPFHCTKKQLFKRYISNLVKSL